LSFGVFESSLLAAKERKKVLSFGLKAADPWAAFVFIFIFGFGAIDCEPVGLLIGYPVT